MNTRNNFKKGSAEMLLLHILQQKGDCYGYEICQLIKELSDGYLSFPEGSMYPALYKLIDNQCITDYKKQVGKRMVRVYYHIEPKGKERLAELIKDYTETQSSIQKILDFNFDELGDSEHE